MNVEKSFSSAILLVGSPRGINSNSESLGGYLLARLRDKGVPTLKNYIHASMATEQGRLLMLKAIDDSDLVILSFPLYVDSIPSSVIAAMESIAAHRGEGDYGKPKKLLAIVQCGFPEARHNETALSIVRRFAKESGMEWAGGLSLGGGMAIGQRPLEDVGRLARRLRKSLDLTAAALSRGEVAPSEAIELMAKKQMPVWLYLFFATRMWKRTAKENGVKDRLYDRPISQG